MKSRYWDTMSICIFTIAFTPMANSGVIGLDKHEFKKPALVDGSINLGMARSQSLMAIR